MSRAITIEVSAKQLSPRARLYGGALVITLSYLLIGNLNNDNPSWVQVHLPLSALSVLLLSLSAAETYLFVQRIQRNSEELQAARVREMDLTQRLAFQRRDNTDHVKDSPALSRVRGDSSDVEVPFFKPERLVRERPLLVS